MMSRAAAASAPYPRPAGARKNSAEKATRAKVKSEKNEGAAKRFHLPHHSNAVISSAKYQAAFQHFYDK